jgi:phage terminase large subunit-like protein
MLSERDRLIEEDPEGYAARLAKLSDTELEFLLTDWHFWARPDQIVPAGDWSTWLILAGRGFGKTRTGAECVRHWYRQGFDRINFIAPTSDDLRDVMVEGESGILSVCHKDERPVYRVSKRRLEWPNGAITLLFSAEEPERLRGKQHEKLWADEPAAWRYGQDAWDQAQFGLRLGDKPQTVATTTPKPTKLILEILEDKNTNVTRGTTYDNKANLAPTFYTKIIKKYEGTRLGRQELNAEVLSDNPGALWRLKDIEAARIRYRRDYRRIVVALDPATTSTETSDEWGIIVAGEVDHLDRDPERPHFDVLEDMSDIYTPDEAAKKAVILYHQYEADRIIGEGNNGGDMIETIIRFQDANVAYEKVTATRGKAIRAEPISALYEQRRVHHVGTLGKLEDELCNWNPQVDEESPNHLDALVWAITALAEIKGDGFGEYYRRKAKANKASRKLEKADPAGAPASAPVFGPGGATKMLPKDVRKWSVAIQLIQLETKAEAMTKEQWEGGFGRELMDWVQFCSHNGGGARLAFAEKELARLEKKFGTIAVEVP